MGKFIRDHVPDWLTYADAHGIVVEGRGKWRAVLCDFHDDHNPSMRVNTEGGGWICMSCRTSGVDTLAYHMRLHNLGFVDAARDLGAWEDDGKPHVEQRPKTLSAREGLEVLHADANLMFVILCDIGQGLTPNDVDRAAAAAAARRVLIVYEGTRQ